MINNTNKWDASNQRTEQNSSITKRTKFSQHSNQQTKKNSSKPQRSSMIQLKKSLAPFQISKGLM